MSKKISIEKLIIFLDGSNESVEIIGMAPTSSMRKP
jgi:hypothetical protein